MLWKRKKYIVDSKTLRDGRILKLCKYGFIDGIIIVPQKRDDYGEKNLEDLRKIKGIKVKEKNFVSYEDIIDIAKRERAKILTVVEEIKKLTGNGDGVIYIDDLFLSMMPVYHVGDVIRVHIEKKGRKNEEGIGYLKVGTKVVVDGGGRYIGVMVNVRIDAIVKTETGQTIFGKVID